MLKTERMTRVLVMGTMDAIGETVDYLYDSGSFHVIDFKRDDVHDIGTPLAGADEASAKLLKMMSVSASLEVEDDGAHEGEQMPVEKVRKELDAALTHLELEISAQTHARKEIEDLLAGKRGMLASLAPFRGLEFPLGLLTGCRSVAVFAGQLKSDPSAELNGITDAYELIRTEEIAVLVVSKPHSEQAHRVLLNHGFSEVKVPPIEGRPSDAMRKLAAEIKELETRHTDVMGRLERLRESNHRFISAALEDLTIQANKAETPLRFGTARFTFLIDAWIPSRSQEQLADGLGKINTGTVEMALLAPDGEPPIKLDNPTPIAPMQMLIEMFSLPRYDEIDPTAFMFITFPLFYGMILGDVGYGAVLLLLVISGALAKLMVKLGMAGGAPGLTKILLYCSVSSIIFGFLFNEFFGFELMALHHGHGEITVLLPHIYYPEFSIPQLIPYIPTHFPIARGDTEMVGPMLILCVCIGIVHLMLGYIAGFRNAWVQHGPKHAILEKGGWCMILAGFSLFAFSFVPRMIAGEGLQFTDTQSLVGLALLGAGVIMAFSVEGINAILELPSLSGNLLSYTRIYAIGLSSIGIAMAFNEYMAIPALEAGGISIILGVLVLIAGHTMNLGLGLIGPLIQTLRLHYVEFFSKFYKGGGIQFNPLKYRRKHTKEV